MNMIRTHRALCRISEFLEAMESETLRAKKLSVKDFSKLTEAELIFRSMFFQMPKSTVHIFSSAFCDNV